MVDLLPVLPSLHTHHVPLRFLESFQTVLTGRLIFFYGIYAIKDQQNLLKIDWYVLDVDVTCNGTF